MANRIDKRLSDLERDTKTPERRILVLYPGDPTPPEASDPNVILLRVVYEDAPKQAA